MALESPDLLVGLRQKYSIALGQDMAIAQEVDQIVSKIKPKPKKPPQLGDMLKGLLGAM